MPKLKIDVTPSLQRLDLVVKGLVNTRFMGSYASAFKGKGLEFANYRVYTQDDDASLIDWKASNRARKLVVKEYVEERNMNVYFIVDVSSTMMVGSTNKLKAEYVAELVASFSHTILKAGDFVGLTMFSDKITKAVMPDNGMQHFHVVSNALSNLSYYQGVSNFKKPLEHALRSFEARSLVILISDFIGMESFPEEVKLAAKKFDLIAIMVRDPRDMTLPEGIGQAFIEDPGTGEKMLVTPNKLKDLYAHETKKEVARLKRNFRDVGADFLPLFTNKSFIEDLVVFFKQRELEWT